VKTDRKGMEIALSLLPSHIPLHNIVIFRRNDGEHVERMAVKCERFLTYAVRTRQFVFSVSSTLSACLSGDLNGISFNTQHTRLTIVSVEIPLLYICVYIIILYGRTGIGHYLRIICSRGVVGGDRGA